MKEETWQELDEKVFDEFSTKKTTFSLWSDFSITI